MSFRDALKLYKFANKQRDEFYNIKWRLVVILLIVAVMWFAYSHLQAAYPSTPERLVSSTTSGTALQASERMFNWFVTGFLVGFLAFALMFEGEFLIATFKLSKLLTGKKTKTTGSQKSAKHRKK
jgi:hypothetical protein